MKTITLKYVGATTTEDVITIKDFSFQWIEVLWDDDGVSITGKKRNNHRGYKAYLELNFERDDQLLSVASNIKTALDSGDVVRYVGSDGQIEVVPMEMKSTQKYINQIKRKPSTLVLEGNITENRVFNVTGILCGSTVVTCGQINVLCGG